MLRSAPDDAFDYSDPRGTMSLRAALAAYLGRCRGVTTTPEQIVICSGFAHGLGVLLKTLHHLGIDTVGMEDPCLPVHREIVRELGMRIAAVPVDHHGAVINRLDRRAQVALVTPAHQYPTGVTLSPDRRMQLVSWAQRTDALIIEDDYDGEFRYDRQPVGALQGLDPNRVVYAGTTSKTIAPGVRTGWLALPKHLVEPVIATTRNTGASPPSLHQLAELLNSSAFDRHLRRLRLEYRRRRDLLLDALATTVPELEPTGVAAGLHVLLYLHTASTEAAVRRLAEERGIALAYLESHWHQQTRRAQGVIIGYSRPPLASYENAVEDLVAVLRRAVIDTADDARFHEPNRRVCYQRQPRSGATT